VAGGGWKENNKSIWGRMRFHDELPRWTADVYFAAGFGRAKSSERNCGVPPTLLLHGCGFTTST